MQMRKWCWVAAMALCLTAVAPGKVSALILDRKEAAPIGEEKEEAIRIALVNGTEKDIDELCVSVDGEDFSKNLLPEGETFQAGEVRVWNLVPAEAKDGKAPVYDLRLGVGEKTYVLHTLPVGDTEEIVLHMEKGVAYIIFDSKAQEKKINTLEQEKELLPKEEAADTSADQTSYQTYDEPADTTSYGSYGEDYTETYETPAAAETPSYSPWDGNPDIGSEVDTDLNNWDFGTEEGGDDHCLDDGIILN